MGNAITTTPTPALADLDLDNLQAIADRVDARGLFNASCDIREWIESARAALARRAAQPVAPVQTRESIEATDLFDLLWTWAATPEGQRHEPAREIIAFIDKFVARQINAATPSPQVAEGAAPIKPWQQRRQEGSSTERAMLDHIADLETALRNIIANAVLQPDVNMGGKTDCYAVPLGDVEAAREAVRIDGEPEESFYRRVVYNNGWNACLSAIAASRRAEGDAIVPSFDCSLAAVDPDGELWRALIRDTGSVPCEYPCLRDDLADWIATHQPSAQESSHE